MSNQPDSRERWHFGGRYYLVTLASGLETMDLELDDVGPSLGRGPVLYASRADDSGAVTIQAHLSDPLPIELVESFLAEVHLRLAP